MPQLAHSHFTLLPGSHCGRSPLLEYLLFLALPRLHTSRGLLGSPGAICDHGSTSLRSKSLGPPALWGCQTRPGPPCLCSSMMPSTQGWLEGVSPLPSSPFFGMQKEHEGPNKPPRLGRLTPSSMSCLLPRADLHSMPGSEAGAT